MQPRLRIPRSDGIDLGLVARRYLTLGRPVFLPRDDRAIRTACFRLWHVPPAGFCSITCRTGSTSTVWTSRQRCWRYVLKKPARWDLARPCTSKPWKTWSYRAATAPFWCPPAHFEPDPRSRAGSAGNASPVCPPAARWGAGDAIHAPLAGRRSPGVETGS